MDNNINPYKKIAYRSLGGVLVFFFVLGITSAVLYGFSTAMGIFGLWLTNSSLAAPTTVATSASNTIISYVVVVSSIVIIIFALYFLIKRDRKKFYILWMIHRILLIIGIIHSAVVLKIDMRYLFYTPSTSIIGNSLADIASAMVIGVEIGSLLFNVAILVIFVRYMKRSERAAVYFDKDYVQPTMVALQYQAGAYYGQHYDYRYMPQPQYHNPYASYLVQAQPPYFNPYAPVQQADAYYPKPAEPTQQQGEVVK